MRYTPGSLTSVTTGAVIIGLMVSGVSEDLNGLKNDKVDHSVTTRITPGPDSSQWIETHETIYSSANETTTGRDLPMVMFCGPSQSSTLLSDVFMKALDLKFPKHLVRPYCPQEFLNPDCNIHPQTVAKCFGAGSRKYYKKIWQTCSTENMNVVMSTLSQSKIGFTKDNFANGKMLLDMHQRGFSIVVAHRLPQHTFPSDRGTQGWYNFIWDSFEEASEGELRQLPSGENLVALRSYISSWNSSSWKGRDHVKACIAHYIHFWHLLKVAIRYDIPHLQIETLLLAPSMHEIISVLIDSGMCGSGRNDDTSCRLIAEGIIQGRTEKKHMHSDQISLLNGSNLTFDLYLQKEQNYLASTSCHSALQDLINFCEDNIPGCHAVNEAYGYHSNSAWVVMG